MGLFQEKEPEKPQEKIAKKSAKRASKNMAMTDIGRRTKIERLVTISNRCKHRIKHVALMDSKSENLRIVETINPGFFSQYEPYVCLSIALCGDKYGIVDGNKNVVCPYICDSIAFGMPYWVAQLQYKGLEFIMDRHSSWGGFLFFFEEWGIVYDINIPYLLTLASWEQFHGHNKKLGCNMSDDAIKAIYDEFVGLLQAQNNIITREKVLKMTDIGEVNEYIDKLTSLKV